MTHTPASEERAAGKQACAGAAMPVSAFQPEVSIPTTPRAAIGRGVAVFAADALSARSGRRGRANR